MALNNKKPVKLWQELVWYGMETFGAWKKLNFKGQKSLEFSRRVAMCCKCITTADHLSVVDMGSNLITKCKYRTKLKLDSCHNITAGVVHYDAFLWAAWKRAEMPGIPPFSRKPFGGIIKWMDLAWVHETKGGTKIKMDFNKGLLLIY